MPAPESTIQLMLGIAATTGVGLFDCVVDEQTGVAPRSSATDGGTKTVGCQPPETSMAKSAWALGCASAAADAADGYVERGKGFPSHIRLSS